MKKEEKYVFPTLGDKMIRSGYILMNASIQERGQQRILKILKYYSDMSQNELQNLLGIQAGSLSEILSKMEKKGFIEKEKDPTDKRKTQLKLTQVGEDALKTDQSKQEDTLSVLTKDEKEQLESILDKYLLYWNNYKFEKK